MDSPDEAVVESVEDPIMGEPGDPDESFRTPRGGGHFHQEPQGISYMLAVLLSVNPWWYVVLAGVAFYLWRRFGHHLEYRVAEWRERRAREAEDAHIKKNPDLYRARMEALDEQRRKMQARYNVHAAVAAEKQAEIDERKRRERAAELENLLSGKGYKNKTKVERAEFSDGVNRGNDAPSTSSGRGRRLRPDYNPLMGNTGGPSGYRPGRRNLNSGG